MKIFFILMLLTYSSIAQNNLPATQRINNLLKMQYNNYLFYVQVGAFKNRDHAIFIQKKLLKMNYPLRLEQRRVDMENYFKLLIGPFESKKEAYSVRNSLPRNYRDAFILTDNN